MSVILNVKLRDIALDNQMRRHATAGLCGNMLPRILY